MSLVLKTHAEEDDDHSLQTHDRTHYKQLLNEIVEDLSEKMDVGHSFSHTLN